MLKDSRGAGKRVLKGRVRGCGARPFWDEIRAEYIVTQLQRAIRIFDTFQ
jgi:hypothetical protein